MKPFIPSLLPLSASNDEWGNMGAALSHALSILGRLNGLLDFSPKSDPFWLLWLWQEAQASNIIEGTVTSLAEVLESQAGIKASPERQSDIEEVVNYRAAMQEGADALKAGQPFSLMLIRALHARLLQGVRGQHKEPGSVRNRQVHIGKPGEGSEKAIYIPPPPEVVPSLLDNLMAFAARQDLDILVQTAVFHAQFEMIHPFLDGNGRLGRLLISLLLAAKGLLTRPVFYLSAYLHQRRSQYYKLLAGISAKGDWTAWIEFFLTAIQEKSQANIIALQNMNSLYDELKGRLPRITASPNGLAILEYAFSQPIFTSPAIAKELGLSPQIVHPVIKKMAGAGIFSPYKPGAGRQASTWVFTRLYAMLREDG